MAQNISKECFPPPTKCYNCHRKYRQGLTKIQEAEKEFKRCSGCHLLSYCDKDCQKEHWDKIHKKHCKFLSGKKVVEGAKHVAESCSLCIQERESNSSDITSCDSPKTNCHVEFVVSGMKLLLGGIFEFHSEGKTCSCTSNKFGCELPFALGEITGTYVVGGADEMLAHAIKILNAMKLKGESVNYRFEDKFEVYLFTISLLRVKYWRNTLIHGSGLQGGIDLSKMTSLEKDVKTTYGNNNAWSAALSFTSDFVLEMDKIQEFMKCDASSLEDPRFPILKRMREYYESQIKLCQEKNALVRFKLWPSVTGGSLVILLPEDIHCGNCQALLTGPVSVAQEPGEDETRPTLMTHAGEQGGLVASCSRTERRDCWVNCTMQNMYYRIQVEGLKKPLDQEYLLFISEIRYCDMCQLASLSSHRCTECLAAQYCSKECQRKDLAFHKTVCSQWAKDKARKLLRGKKQVEINKSKLVKRCEEAKEAGTK